MYGITFGDKHSYDDYGLWLTGVDIGQPVPKRTTVEVPGTDGVIDLTNALSEETFYKNRKLTFTFQIKSEYDWDSIMSEINNDIHGHHMHVIQDIDPGWYWDGFVTVDSFASDRKLGTIIIRTDADPYKYKTALTTKSASISGSGTITCTNIKKKVVPEITTSAAITVALSSHSVSLEAGTHRAAALALSEGTNTFNVTGTADVSISYREGSL